MHNSKRELDGQLYKLYDLHIHLPLNMTSSKPFDVSDMDRHTHTAKRESMQYMDIGCIY